MAHEISSTAYPNILVMRISGDLTHDDMTCDEELGLNDNPLFICLDVSQMNHGLPEGFLDGAKQSFFIHPNMRHLALYTGSVWLDAIGRMVSKVTRRQSYLSMHDSFDDAFDHLVMLAKSND